MFYEIYCELCKKHGLTPSGAATKIGFNRASVTMWKSTGKAPKQELLVKIADFFGVTTDYLLGQDTEKEKPVLTAKDERDIARNLEKIMADLENSGDLMFDGDPMSDEARESIRSALKLGLEAAKLKNKELYTPKKYRKG